MAIPRVSRGVTRFSNEYCNQVIDQMCAAINRIAGQLAESKEPTIEAAPSTFTLVNSGTKAFSPGLLGGYSSTGQVTLAKADNSAPIAARFVAMANAAPDETLLAASVGRVPVQLAAGHSPAKQGTVAWLSQTNAGYVTETRPTSGYKQMIGVFDTKDSKTGLWTVLLAIDVQLIRIGG